MDPHLDRHRTVFWVEDDATYHEAGGLEEEDGDRRGRCGAVAGDGGHAGSALDAEVMGLRPCRECHQVVSRELTAAAATEAPAPPWTAVEGDAGAGRVRAVIFDTDGVVTRTASVHEKAWRALFDRFLQARAEIAGEDLAPFGTDDYRRHIDGKPRLDGVAGFLASRNIDLPWGSPSDDPDDETVCGLGNRKNRYFLEELHRNGAAPYESTLALVRHLRDLGVPSAVVSASENCEAVLEAAGATGLFALRVDGLDAARLGLAGKPDPALFLEAARQLGEEPAGCTVVEDALAGVEAGRRGGFGVVIGVDRTGHPADLAEHGAQVVVPDLAWVDLGEDRRWQIATTSITRGRA